MPVVPDEAAAYGYEAEDRHFVRVFLGKEKPLLDFHDGIEVVRVLMAAYKSAEAARTVDIETEPLEDFVPMVAQGTWRP
jgi:predicted dehydrogenase